MTSIHWYLSKTIRQATDVRSQVQMLLNEQRDLLTVANIANLEAGIASMNDVLRRNPGKKAVTEEMAKLEKIANSNLKPYPAAAIRENVKEVLVAITTIMAFTTFFLQLTKIPTGSMQPTLYGITDENLLNQTEITIPNFLGRVKDYWVWGIQYNWFIAPEDGEFSLPEDGGLRTILPFVKKQRFNFAGKSHDIWFPGDGLFGGSESGRGMRAVVRQGAIKKGEYVFAMKIVAGDHLLVDRLTYNFRKPERGEIIVFKTRGIEGLPQDQLYIKRLVGLSGEKIQIGDDRHLIADGRRITAADRHFEMVYSIDDKSDPLVKAENQEDWFRALAITNRKPPYRGHVNDKIAREIYHDPRGIAPLFPDENKVFPVGPERYLPMGDNQLNSSDGRVFGDFDRKNIIGRCWFVYWPFTDRFGWGYR